LRERSMRDYSQNLASSRGRLAATLLGPVLLWTATVSSSAETRGYVVSWFATATHAQDFNLNCPSGKNGGGLNLAIRDLMDIGYSREEATRIATSPDGEYDGKIYEKIVNRAIVSGKHVSVYNYPDAVADPQIETVAGKYAYGFDLGGPV